VVAGLGIGAGEGPVGGGNEASGGGRPEGGSGSVTVILTLRREQLVTSHSGASA
jgi:hypothetical protein